MEFVNASYLYGLFGLVIPIAIHLWSKKEGKVIQVGSLKYIPEFETKQSKSVKLNELPLLIVRCLVLSLFCLLMAELLTVKKASNTNAIVLIEPSLLQDTRVKNALDTLQMEKRLLSKGLSFIEDQNESFETVPIWDVFDEVSKLPADTVYILTTVTENDLRGKRPATNKVVHWLPIESLENEEYTHRSFSNGYDLVATSNAISTKYQWSQRASEVSNQVENWDTLKIDIVYDLEFEKELKYFQSALATISEIAKRPIIINDITLNKYQNSSSDWLIWLSKEPPSAQQAGNILSYREDILKPILSNTNGHFYLNNRITHDNFIAEDFIGQLFEIIIPITSDTKEQRQVPIEMVKLNQSDIEIGATNKATADWLWLVFIGLFLFERFYSMKRKQ
ncbi:MAG: BatA domain-containing protein [Fulvivirga sp.]|uniref:BatA domain-containing protein n=1 Tax=Fulvivirga sp. TaxID=1931237 RepID=UPI0032F037ED